MVLLWGVPFFLVILSLELARLKQIQRMLYASCVRSAVQSTGACAAVPGFCQVTYLCVVPVEHLEPFQVLRLAAALETVGHRTSDVDHSTDLAEDGVWLRMAPVK